MDNLKLTGVAYNELIEPYEYINTDKTAIQIIFHPTNGSIEEAVEVLMDIYHNDPNSCSMCEVLASTELIGYSIENTVTVYATAKHEADDDHMYLCYDDKIDTDENPDIKPLWK